MACRRTVCQEFCQNKRGKGERRGHAKLMLPGMACGTKCNAYPCVAKLARRASGIGMSGCPWAP